ncbi:hypothetical protein SDC9_117778 [bioreactor metagenome]|uniref:Uncharacterized protein n=1 Tax=bioreactor metagenome TaxID=1076179 RepID=A0A645C0G0_9ZZZZ
MRGLEPADCLDRGQSVAPGLLLTGGDGEGEAVDKDVALIDAPVVGERSYEPLGDLHLPFGGAGLALLVDGQRHDRGAVLLDQRHHPLEAGVRAVAVFEVDRVDDGPARKMIETGFDHGGLGRVEHHRQGHGAGEPGREFDHVLGPVASDIVDTQIDDVCPGTGLVASDLDALVPVAREHRLAEGLRTVRVGALPDRQIAGVLFQRDIGIQRGHRVDHLGGALLDRALRADGLNELTDVFGGGAAASAHQGQAALVDVVVQGTSQFGRLQRIARTLGGQLGQTGVGHRRQADTRMAREIAQMLTHLGWTGRAVESQNVDAQRREGCQRGADLAAQQHRPGGLDRDRHEDRQVVGTGCRAGPLGADHRGLGLLQVLAGLDLDCIDAAADHGLDLRLVGITQGDRLDMAQGGQFGAGPHTTEHETWPIVRAELVGHLPGEPGARLGQLRDLIADAVLVQSRVVGAEGVGLDAVTADAEVGAVNVGHHIGTRAVEYLVAALVALEVLE